MRRSIALALTGCLGLAEDLIHPLARKRFGHHPETDVIADPHPSRKAASMPAHDRKSSNTPSECGETKRLSERY
jgi:hypothetical protein